METIKTIILKVSSNLNEKNQSLLHFKTPIALFLFLVFCAVKKKKEKGKKYFAVFQSIRNRVATGQFCVTVWKQSASSISTLFIHFFSFRVF